MYPELEIDLDKIRRNVRTIRNILKPKGIELMGVAKVASGLTFLTKILNQEGIKWIGDSRIQNVIRARKDVSGPKFALIRSPQISEIRSVVKYSDASFVTEVEALKALSNSARLHNSSHSVISMVEMGDLREGVMPGNMVKFVREILALPKIHFLGIGASLGDLSGVSPTLEKIDELISIRDNIIDKGIDVEIVSFGGSAALELFQKNQIEGINQLRIGEAIVLGRNPSKDEEITYLERDAVALKAEIIEIKEKPSSPYGVIGKDAFGNVRNFVNNGIRKRAILALGVLEIDENKLHPQDENVRIIGATSDHLVVDITDSDSQYKVGDIMRFTPRYLSLLRLMNSKYVKKNYKENAKQVFGDVT